MVQLGNVSRRKDVESILWIAGSVHRVLVDSTATEGRLTVFRSTMNRGASSPVHVHPNEDETICLLSGQMQIWVGRNRWTLGSGDSAFMPRGVPHTYLISSPEADLLTVCSPSGMEEFSRLGGHDLAEPVPDGWKVDVPGLASIAARTGQQVLGPPLEFDDDMPSDYLYGPSTQ